MIRDANNYTTIPSELDAFAGYYVRNQLQMEYRPEKTACN